MCSVDTESRAWVEALSGTGRERDEAIERLHALLLRAACFEVARRGQVANGFDDLAMQAADDALMAIMSKLHTFRGESRFTTWASKFALLEAGVKMRRRAWQGREVPLESDGGAEVREAIADALTPHQRAVLVAITLNDVPIDVLAERLNSTRGALYKSLHDARRTLRARLAHDGHIIDS